MERIAHFEIGAPLGRGGYALVNRARDTMLDREVAVKRLLPEIADDAEALHRISEEARAIARLAHPGIVRLFDVLRHGQEVVLVMELVPGMTLHQRLATGTLGSSVVAGLGTEVATALAHAHERGIIHRDLKPSNLILEPGGRVKVMDFGLVRFLSAVPLLDTADADSLAVGTPPYMSPEQVRGLPVDARSDIFSLGIVLYELVVGVRPFRGASFAELARAILYREPDWDIARLGSGLHAVLVRAMAKEPWERYQDMRSMAADLALVARPELSAGPPVLRTPTIVGRRHELDTLSSELERVLAPGGRGRVVVLAGEAGVGKTALVTEFLQTAAVSRRVPQCLARFHEGDRGYAVLLKVMTVVVAAADARAAPLSQERPFGETLDGVLSVLGRGGPFLWVIENLHDAGADALLGLRLIMEAMPRTRGLLVLTYRSEERLAVGQDRLRDLLATAATVSTSMTLPRFTAAETRALLARMLDPRQPPDERLVEHVQHESEGVPLFIRETVLYLRQSGRVTADGILDMRVGNMRLPDRIRHLLARRVEGVPPDLMRTLQAAAVAGVEFEPATLARVLERSVEGVLADLARLKHDHELVEESESRYHFAHAKIREVVMDALSVETRAALHARFGDTLRRDPDAPAAAVARHLVAAGRVPDAVPFLVAAARAAGRLAANEEARMLYAQVAESVVTITTGVDRAQEHLEMLLELGCLEKIAGQQSSARETFTRVAGLAGAAGRLRGTALHHLGCALIPAGDLAGARTHFEQARLCFEAERDDLWSAGCYDMLGVVARHSGDLAGALRETRKALAMREAAGNRWGQALSQSNLGAIYFSLGRYRRALACFELSVGILESEAHRLDTRQRLAQGLDNVGVVACELGLLERALEAEGRALAIERDIADRETEANSLVNLAAAHATLGLNESAADGFQRAARLALAVSSRVARTEALRGLGSLRLNEGRLDEALLLLEEALSVATATGSSEMRGLAWLEMGSAALARRRPEDAIRFAAQVADVAVAGKVERLAPALAFLQARIHRVLGQPAETRAELERALSKLRGQSRPELAWRVHRELSGLTGDDAGEPSRRHLVAARRIVRRVARGIRDPRLRRAYLGSRERAELLATNQRLS